MLANRPWRVTLLIVLAVTTHAVVAREWWTPLYIWRPLIKGSSDVASGIYLATSGAAAMAAGFAGVVIIFGLDSRSEKFLLFRQVAGKSLRANWMSVIASSFAAAGVSLLAAVLVALGFGWLAPWVFELAVLLLVHAVLRMLWLLRSLMRVVAADDAAVARAASAFDHQKHWFGND